MTASRYENDFEALEVSQIYCPTCAGPMPVRKRLLLVLLDKETYDYVCTGCGSPIGKKEEPLSAAPVPPPRLPKKWL